MIKIFYLFIFIIIVLLTLSLIHKDKQDYTQLVTTDDDSFECPKRCIKPNYKSCSTDNSDKKECIQIFNSLTDDKQDCNNYLQLVTPVCNFLTEYKQHYINYLQLVYPLGKFNKLSTFELLKLYNSLSFYYNPCSEYKNTDLTNLDKNNIEVCGTVWDSLDICKKIKIKNPPIGRFLSFFHYNKNNIYSVISDGTGDISDWTSYRQTLHWGASETGGEISRTCRSGPGPYWITTFSLIKDMYYPNGIFYNQNNKTWNIKCDMSSSKLNNNCDFNKKTNWTSGYKEGEYIEVTHSQNNPGMAQSVGFWFNGFPSGGTGMFLKIGKTHISNNKIDTLFNLLTKLKFSSSTDLHNEMKQTKFNNMSGSNILFKYYNTDDPYIITWGYANGEWGPMSTTEEGDILIDPRDIAWKYIGNKGVLSASGLMNSPTDINISKKDGDGYKNNLTTKFEDIAKWWLIQNNILDGLTYDNKKKVIDAARNPQSNSDYFPNRAACMLPPDEPIGWLSYVLGIETIQMPMSANDNGLWCYEIIDYRLPTSKGLTDIGIKGFPEQYDSWLNSCRERKYSYISNKLNYEFVGSGSPSIGPTWNPDAQKWWMVYIQKFLSSRNPLNIKEDGINCNSIGYIVPEITEKKCENPFPKVEEVPSFKSNGLFDLNKCWVAVENIGWQNIFCLKNSLSYYYLKIPLNYPAKINSNIKKLNNTPFSSQQIYSSKQVKRL